MRNIIYAKVIQIVTVMNLKKNENQRSSIITICLMVDNNFVINIF